MPFESLQSYVIEKMKRHTPASNHSESFLPTVWDEAQLLLAEDTDMFLSVDGKSKRPLYTALIRAHAGLRELLQKPHCGFPVVALGTGLSLRQARDAITSSIAKYGLSYVDMILSNGYDTPLAVQTYIAKYFPSIPFQIAALFVGRSRYAAKCVESIIKFSTSSRTPESIAISFYNETVEELKATFAEVPGRFPSEQDLVKKVFDFLEDGIFNVLLV